MKAIVSRVTDSTNVWGYVSVDVLDDRGLVDESAYERLPGSVREECREQHPSIDSRSIHNAERRVVNILKNFGFTVLDSEGKPHAG